MDPGETATAFAYASWSWTVVCLFLSGIFFGSFISGMLLSWKALLSSKFRALLGYQDSDSGEEGSRLGQEVSASLHSLGSNISKDSSLIQQADSACYHLPPESKSIISERSTFYKRGYKYDVYLSFAGDKKCISFINYLKYHLLKEDILVYRDEVDLQKVDIITAPFRQGIKDSRISIVVFSRHFASSILCLEELVAIVDCHKDKKQELVPIFYDVDPRDVRHQSGACKFAFDSLRKRVKDYPDKIYKWKGAMTYLAKLSGFHLTHQAKAEWIERIVEEVSDILVYKFQRTRSTDKTPGFTQRRPSLQEVNKYDVFLSLRRTHTSYTLIDNLYHCLTKEGFSTFKSDDKIQRKESIPSQVLQAIKDSQILIVVFTRDYADSTSSLEEIATIVECHQEPKQTIIPVFFDVDSMDVRRQTGPYEKAFTSYTKEFKQDPFKVQRWRSALKRMANLSGVVLRDEYVYKPYFTQSVLC
ncbi:uncharacterized protein LOC127741146 [Arachis duranensis]|uniref:ADP-ribosyl cyclase/cyclic ADP-ribose hydrolase n=1 Tax=Arachis duranensis TaxID=130453 RepID=A0A9C6TE37_ARADU|nr:uncharacterized protein LOC127741146 [Arachis duranensis]